MSYRTLELTLISANDLKHVTFISKMEVYAISSIDGYPKSQQRTPADREGGTSPVWNTTLRFSIPPGDPSNHFLHVLLRCHRILGVRDIGEVRLPLKELLNCFAAGKGALQFVRCQLRNLPYKYKFLDVTPLRADEPVKALMDGEPVTAGKDGGVVNLSYKFLDPAPAPAGYGYPPVGNGDGGDYNEGEDSDGGDNGDGGDYDGGDYDGGDYNDGGDNGDGGDYNEGDDSDGGDNGDGGDYDGGDYNDGGDNSDGGDYNDGGI